MTQPAIEKKTDLLLQKVLLLPEGRTDGLLITQLQHQLKTDTTTTEGYIKNTADGYDKTARLCRLS